MPDIVIGIYADGYTGGAVTGVNKVISESIDDIILSVDVVKDDVKSDLNTPELDVSDDVTRDDVPIVDAIKDDVTSDAVVSDDVTRDDVPIVDATKDDTVIVLNVPLIHDTDDVCNPAVDIELNTELDAPIDDRIVSVLKTPLFELIVDVITDENTTLLIDKISKVILDAINELVITVDTTKFFPRIIGEIHVFEYDNNVDIVDPYMMPLYIDDIFMFGVDNVEHIRVDVCVIFA